MSSRPTRAAIDALVGPATPHFAYQLRGPGRELVADLPPDDELRRYAEAQMELLDRLGHASSKAARGPARAGDTTGLGARSRARAPADAPLPRARAGSVSCRPQAAPA